MDDLITPRYELVELQVPASQTAAGPITFQQQPQLQSFYNTSFFVYILAIDLMPAAGLPFSPFNANNPVSTEADNANAVLTLVRLGDEAHKFVPLTQLNRFQSAVSTLPNVRDPFRLPDEWQIDWTKSYITLVKPPISTPPFSYIFGVHYSYYPTPDAIKAGITPALFNITGPSMMRRRG